MGRVSEKKLREWYDKGFIEATNDGYKLTSAGKTNLSQTEKTVLMYSGAPLADHVKGSGADAGKAYEKGVADTTSKYATPNADVQIAKAEENKAQQVAETQAQVQAEQTRLTEAAAPAVEQVQAQTDQLLTQLAQTTQPDYAAQYQELYQSSLDTMKAEWEAQRQASQQAYEASLAQTQEQFNKQQEEYKAKIQETQGTISQLQADIEAERNRTGEFNASVFNPEAGRYSSQAQQYGQGALSQLQELMKVYAFDPVMQQKIQQEYTAKVQAGQTEANNLAQGLQNEYQAGVGQFQAGQVRLTDLPALYGRQTAFNQGLQAKQQGLLTSMQGLGNIESELQRRVKEDAANIQAQRLAEKQGLQAQQAQAQMGQRQQANVNAGASRNVKNIQNRGLGSGFLTNYFTGVR